MKRIKKILIIIVIVAGVATYVGLHHIAPYAIIQPPRTHEAITPDDLGLASEDIRVVAEDSIVLNGYWINSNLDSARGIVLLIHGIGGCKEHFLGLAQTLAEMGIASIVFDLRAHGESGGKYCTYGYKEKKDVARIVDEIKRRKPELPIGVWGNSLGGAIAIQALEYDERINFGIVESTFSELDKIVYDYKKRKLRGIGFKFLSDYALQRAGEIADFEPERVKPIESVKNVEQPVLIAHGDADRNISVAYGKALFDHLKSERKELVIVPGGRHFGLFEQGGDAYAAKVFGFIEKSIMKQNHQKNGNTL